MRLAYFKFLKKPANGSFFVYCNHYYKVQLIMKNIGTLILLFLMMNITPLFSQDYYELQWKQVENNAKKGIYKSNLPIFLDIQDRAKKEGNVTQLIRALKGEFGILTTTHDDTQNDLDSQFFKKLGEIETSLKGENQLVFQVLKGSFIKEYYSNNRWKIDGRTAIDKQDFSQIETWSKLDFKNYLSQHFSKMEPYIQALKNIPLSKYQSIFIRTEDLEYYPDLFTWNAVQYIEFLEDVNYFTRNELVGNQPKIDAQYTALVAHNTGNSRLMFKHKLLKERCIASHCKDELQQLIGLEKETSGDYAVKIISDIAQQLNQQGKEKEALEWLRKAEEKYPKSPFLNEVKNEINQIVAAQLKLAFDVENSQNLPIHLVAEHKNVNQFSMTIYQMKDDEHRFLRFINDSRRRFSGLNKTLIRKETFDLENKKDYRNYKTSLAIQPLPAGIYVGEYVVNGKVQGYFHFIVSNTTLVYKSKSTKSTSNNILKLVDRENGQHFKNQKVEVYELGHSNQLIKTEYTTNAEGEFSLSPEEENIYSRILLIKRSGTEEYHYFNDWERSSYYPNREYTKYKAQIFLDRAVYRPGQVVYFKVISTKLNLDKEEVFANTTQEVILHDANGEEIAKQQFTTNEYGSYHGSFTLPKGLLNGHFYIKVKAKNALETLYESKSFRVEEYEKPNFEVTFMPIKEEYQYGQTIALKGKAVSFSGVPLNNVEVQYEIKKENIRWKYFGWYPHEVEDNENSILGTATTDEKGEFTISLDLKKDDNVEGVQVHHYVIEADVTDINGETQSASTSLRVASVSHYITASGVQDTFSDEAVKIKVETKNYSEQNLKKSYSVKLSQLEAPQRVFRDNFRKEIQDLPKLSREEFIRKFPHDRYDKNDLPEHWKTIKTTERMATSEEVEQSWLQLGKLSAGHYQLELYNIEGQDTIRYQKQFEVFDKRFLADTQKPFLKVLQGKKKLKQNEKGSLYIYSAIPNAKVNIYVQKGDGETYTISKNLDNGVLHYEVENQMNEEFPQLDVQVQLVAYNDIQTQKVNFIYLSEKQPLRIETVTFRDKLQPNSKERWTVKILGNDKEKVQAEVLANMYDKALDQFASNSYSWTPLRRKYSIIKHYAISKRLTYQHYNDEFEYLSEEYIEIPIFSWVLGNYAMRTPKAALMGRVEGVPIAVAEVAADATAKVEAVAFKSKGNTDSGLSANQEEVENLDKVPVRDNLKETAFFYPNLLTDNEGNVQFEFTSPEALTQWKLMFLAHTKDARAAVLEQQVITQKEFSVTPNYPRFLREGDGMQFQSKLSNLTDKPLNGVAQLQILDALTNEEITEHFGVSQRNQAFQLNGNASTAVKWSIKVPNQFSSIILKVVAKAGDYADGEQKALPILPNRILVTDTQPILVKEGQTKTFVLKNLAENRSSTVKNVSNTLELTTNPIWEIMLALPSLKDDAHWSADVQFNRWFADVLASEIFKANPKLKAVFDEYQNKGLLVSNLEKHQELKQLILEETPWILESKTETEQMQKLARLFDANTMRQSIHQDWNDLKKLQNPDGGFSWYSGYPSSYYTSLYILKNWGRIKAWLKGNMTDYTDGDAKAMERKLVAYVDEFIHQYAETRGKTVWNNFVLDYLDTRHYWEKDYPLKGKGAQLKTLVIQQASKADIKDFTFFGLHRAAMLFHHYQLSGVSKKLLTYLKETSTETETQGIYWKQNLNDWGWHSSKVVNHAGALEAFEALVPNDTAFIEELKIWLVTQKEVSAWETSRSTAEVIYTILNSGTSWTTAESEKVAITWGRKPLQERDGVQRATGYLKSSVQSDKVDADLASVTITKSGAGIVQGGVFWQYYEDLDKVKSTATHLSVSKEFYKKIKTENGEELKKITPTTPLKIGDKVTVRLILNTDRAMEFIHLKDMRAAGLEPLDVLSGYRWKNNLGYYQSTKDASTNFYIEYMPKGKYVFEYDLVCNASGDFSSGITTLQNYYAPQMNAREGGMRLEIGE